MNIVVNGLLDDNVIYIQQRIIRKHVCCSMNIVVNGLLDDNG